MIKYFLFIIVSLHFYSVNAQDIQFPKDFIGDWIGDLNIHDNAGLRQTLPMELIIEPIDSVKYTWSLIYGEDKEAGLRAYTLVELDQVKGHYEIDEDNSIVLDGYFLGHKFYQQFEVKGNLILLSLEKRNQNLLFEIIMGGYESIRTTGDKIIEGDTIPPVKSFAIKISQTAILERINK